MQVPCAAMGLLHSMEQNLLERKVWSGALDMLPAPAFLSLMLVLVPLQPLFHTKASHLSGSRMFLADSEWHSWHYILCSARSTTLYILQFSAELHCFTKRHR